MRKNEISANAQKSLRNSARKELARLELELSSPQTLEAVDRLKDRFSMCEIVYKVILREYKFEQDGHCPDKLKINMTDAPAALKFAGYDFDRTILKKLFGAEKHAGQRSVKIIRDLLTHKLSGSALNELLEREQELHGYMDYFLDMVRNADIDS